MKFPKLPNSCFMNDGIVDKLLRLFYKLFTLTFYIISKQNYKYIWPISFNSTIPEMGIWKNFRKTLENTTLLSN